MVALCYFPRTRCHSSVQIIGALLTIVTRFTHEFDAPVNRAFDAVADLSAYPALFSEVSAVRIRPLTDHSSDVDLLISTGPFRERFLCHLSLSRYERIEATLSRGSLRSLEMQWTFQPISDHATLVSATLTIALRLAIAEPLVKQLIDRRLPAIARRFAAAAADDSADRHSPGEHE